MNPDAIKQNVLKLQNANATPDDIESYVKSASSEAPEPHQNNFLQSMFAEPAKALLARPVFRTIQAFGGLAGNAAEQAGNMMGNESVTHAGQAMENAAEQPMNMHIPIFGDINVEGQKDLQSGGIPQIVGHGLEAASYLVPSGTAEGMAENLVKGKIMKAMLGGAAAGGQFAGISGVGGGLTEDNPTVGSVATRGIESGLEGTALGGLFGLGGGIASKALNTILPVAKDIFTQGPKAAVQNAARNAVENEFRDTVNKYGLPSRNLENMEGKAGTNPIGVISSYGNKAIPQLKQGKINPGEAIDFLKLQIGELSQIKSDAVKLNNNGVKLPDFRSEAESLVNNEGWSAMKRNQVSAQVDNILSEAEGTYKKGYMPLSEVDRIKTEQTGLSKSYNNTGKEPFQYDAHAIVGKAARNIVEKETGDAPTQELNKLIQSHYDAVDLLESLRGKAPHGGILTRELSRLGGEVTGSIVGGAIGHPFLGAMAGRMGADTILGVLGNDFISDPVKRMIIKNLDDVEPSVVQKALQYIDEQSKANGSRLALPGKGETSAPLTPASPTTYEPQARQIRQHDTGVPQLLLPEGSTKTPQTPISVYPETGSQMDYVGNKDVSVPNQRSLPNRAEKNLPTNSANSTANAIIPNDNTMNNKSGKIALGTLLGLGIGTAGATGASIPSVSQYHAESTPATAIPTPNPSVDTPKLMNAVKYNETRGEKEPYSFSQPSGVKAYGRALGAYQITEAELKSYAQKFLGKAVSAAEFLKSPKLQDAYMKSKIEALAARGLSPDEILAVHNKGMSNLTDEGIATATEKAKHYIESGMKQYAGRSFKDLADKNK